jgi:acetyltransferase-like isoleucine patch superfamily enzyme
LENPPIAKTAKLHDRDHITLAERVYIKDFCVFDPWGGRIEIGEHTYIGPFCVIYGCTAVIIGRDVMVGPQTIIASGNHEIRHLEKPMCEYPLTTKGPIVVEDDVWIGANCVICDGVTLGKGCVIGAGAVVTRSTEPYGIYTGIPAKKIGSRLALTS